MEQRRLDRPLQSFQGWLLSCYKYFQLNELRRLRNVAHLHYQILILIHYAFRQRMIQLLLYLSSIVGQQVVHYRRHLQRMLPTPHQSLEYSG